MRYQYGKRTSDNRPTKRGVGKQSLLIAGVFGIAITAASFNFGVNRAAATVPGTNTRVSLTGSGTQPSQESLQSMISRDGRFVVFINGQNGFVGTDTNNKQDVFVRDVANSTVTRASMSSSGVSADKGASVPIISETGRYVVFVSDSTNLIDGRTISATYPQMYVRDRVAGTTGILSEVSPGTFANNSMIPLSVSSDGRFILFTSAATNLGPAVSSGYSNLFLLDRVTNAISWINAQGSGITYGYDTYYADMSCDGSFIVFNSDATYLGLPYSYHVDTFLFDRRGGNRLTNITGSSNGAALRPKISCNGNYIGFASNANNLDPLTAGLAVDYHAYIYDRIDEQFKLLDQSSTGTRANAYVMRASFDPFYLSVSDKGAAVFSSTATNLDPVSSSGRQLYIRDSKAGTTERLSRDSSGVAGNGDSQFVSISLDGKLAAYESYASNLVGGDTNGVRDVFVSETGL